MSTTSFTRAWEVVNGFFIGGGGDDLHQENLTKADLARAIQGAIDEATKDADLQVDEMRPVVNAAKRLSQCAEEFDGDLKPCDQWLDAFWAEVSKYEKREWARQVAAIIPHRKEPFVPDSSERRIVPADQAPLQECGECGNIIECGHHDEMGRCSCGGDGYRACCVCS